MGNKLSKPAQKVQEIERGIEADPRCAMELSTAPDLSKLSIASVLVDSRGRAASTDTLANTNIGTAKHVENAEDEIESVHETISVLRIKDNFGEDQDLEDVNPKEQNTIARPAMRRNKKRSREKRVTFADADTFIEYEVKDAATRISVTTQYIEPRGSSRAVRSRGDSESSTFIENGILKWTPLIDYHVVDMKLMEKLRSMHPSFVEMSTPIKNISLKELWSGPNVIIRLGRQLVEFSMPKVLASYISKDVDWSACQSLDLPSSCAKCFETLLHWTMTGVIYFDPSHLKKGNNSQELRINIRKKLILLMKLYKLADDLKIMDLLSVCLAQMRDQLDLPQERCFHPSIKPAALEDFLKGTCASFELSKTIGRWIGGTLHTWGSEFDKYKKIFERNPELVESAYK